MKNILSLNGDWSVTGFDPEGTRRLSLAGHVPGHIHPDLMRAGMISDPFWRDQADQCQWVEHWTWRYAYEFEAPAGFVQPWTVLRFEGLDTFASIFLNGRYLGDAANMFIPHEFEVGDKLLPGQNRVEVRFAPAVKSVAHKPCGRYTALFNPGGERVYARKMQCGYGWDWVHRLVSAGIWRPCALIAYDGARVEDVFASVTALRRDEAEVRLEVTAAAPGDATVSARITIADPEGQIVWEGSIRDARAPAVLTARIAEPRWWWPVGYGEQPLYTVKTSLHGDGGRLLDEHEFETGLRTVAIRETPDDDGSSFTLMINDTPIFAKGGNWVPADPFPSQITPGRYARLIEQAKSARLNLLRAWGGGVYEPDEFWRECNRAGVMVSQDFLLACAQYPEDDPEWVAAVRQEFAAAIKTLRNHPALVFWCGDNELGLGSRPDDAWNGKALAREVTGPLCAELDPGRPFRLTSPYGGDPNNSPLVGDHHTNAQFTTEAAANGMRDYRQAISGIAGRFMSEYAASGAPPMRTLRKFMTEADLRDTAMWEYRTKDNPYSGASRTLFQMVAQGAAQLYGDPGGDTDRVVRQMEYVQYEFVRLGVEAARRRKPWCGGIQFWMYNDCWPAAGWSVLDYWGDRKAAWYGMHAGFRPIIAACETTEDQLRCWVCSDLLEPASVDLHLRVQPWRGEPRWSETVSVEAPANASVIAVDLPLAQMREHLGTDAVFVCDLHHASGEDRSWLYPGLPREMQPPPAGLRVTERRDLSRGEGEVAIHAENYARVVTLEAAVDFSDNYFEMLPGETRTITWNSTVRPFADAIRVTCWNP